MSDERFPPTPPAVPMILEYLEWLRGKVEYMTVAHTADTFMVAKGSIAASQLERLQEQQNINTGQKLELLKSAFGNIDIISSPYVPRTVRKQFRFPRSKKKRIRKKWRGQQRNWREEQVLWLVNMADLRPKFVFDLPRRFGDQEGLV